MKAWTVILSRGMLILGVVSILAGIGWGLGVRLAAPPPPTIAESGAVVLVVTAPVEPVASSPMSSPLSIPSPGPSPSQPPHTMGPAPAFLPAWQGTEVVRIPTPIGPRATPLPPIPNLTPTHPACPQAQKPPTRIVAPAINLDARVIPMGWDLVDHSGTMVSEWVVPKGAAGWHINSALPGHGNNVVLSGHHNIEGKVFRRVVDLNPGDEITLYVGDTPYLYLVTEKYILKEAGMPLRVRLQNARWIVPTGDERLTLVTCWPYEWPGNSHRVIVVARPPDPIPPVTIDDVR